MKLDEPIVFNVSFSRDIFSPLEPLSKTFAWRVLLGFWALEVLWIRYYKIFCVVHVFDFLIYLYKLFWLFHSKGFHAGRSGTNGDLLFPLCIRTVLTKKLPVFSKTIPTPLPQGSIHDAIVRGLLASPLEGSDLRVTAALRNKLFATPGDSKTGQDLFAKNIARGEWLGARILPRSEYL